MLEASTSWRRCPSVYRATRKRSLAARRCIPALFDFVQVSGFDRKTTDRTSGFIITDCSMRSTAALDFDRWASSRTENTSDNEGGEETARKRCKVYCHPIGDSDGSHLQSMHLTGGRCMTEKYLKAYTATSREKNEMTLQTELPDTVACLVVPTRQYTARDHCPNYELPYLCLTRS